MFKRSLSVSARDRRLLKGNTYELNVNKETIFMWMFEVEYYLIYFQSTNYMKWYAIDHLNSFMTQ